MPYKHVDRVADHEMDEREGLSDEQSEHGRLLIENLAYTFVFSVCLLSFIS